METFGQKMRRLRFEHNYKTQDDALSEFNRRYNCEFGKASLSKYENDKGMPEVEYLKKWAEFYDVSVDYLLGLSDSSTPSKEDKIITKNEIRDIIADTVAQANDETTKESIRAILRIKDSRDRQRVLQLIKTFAEDIDKDNDN